MTGKIRSGQTGSAAASSGASATAATLEAHRRWLIDLVAAADESWRTGLEAIEVVRDRTGATAMLRRRELLESICPARRRRISLGSTMLPGYDQLR